MTVTTRPPGNDIEPVPTRRSPARRALRSTAWRHRRSIIMLWPIMWMAALETIAIIFNATHLQLHWRIIAIIVIVATLLVWIERRGGKPSSVAITAAALWLLAAHIWGPFGGTLLVLVAGGGALAIPFWRRHRHLYRRRDEPDVEELPTEPGESREQAIYAQRVIPNEPGIFGGTTLDTPEPVPGVGFTAEIVGTPGKTKISQLMKGVETIASAWEISMPQVILEPARSGNTSRARLTVIERPDILQVTRWLEVDGPSIDPETGIGRVAYFGDSQPAHWAWYTRKRGAQMGCNCGTTGSGKSEFGSTKMALARRCETIVTVLLDAQGGASQPDWNDHAHLTALGVPNVFAELLCWDYVMGRRGEYVAKVPWIDEQGRERRGKKFLFPGDPDVGGTSGVPYSGMKLIWFVFEEIPLLLKSPTYGAEAIKILSPAAKTWRKPGGSIDIYAQNIGLNELLDDPFRANIFGGGSIAAFRTGSSVDHHMAGLVADPSKLPEWFPDGEETAGLGYLKGVDRRPGASMRSMPVKDVYGIATSPAACEMDAMTLGFREEYFHHLSRGRQPKAAVVGEQVEQTPGDVEAVVEEVLSRATRMLGLSDIVAAAGGQLGETTLGELKAAIARLEKRLPIARDGDTYVLLTPEGTLPVR